MTDSGIQRARSSDAVVVLGLAVVVGAVFFARFPIPLQLLSRHLLSAVVALVVLAASATCGSFAFAVANRAFGVACRTSTLESRADWLEVMFAGIPVFGTLMAAIAWIGVRIHLVVPIVTFVLALVTVARLVRGGGPQFGQLPRRGLLVLAIPLGFALIEALSPVSSPDELIYKLAVPHAYLTWGSMVELPLNSNAYFPNAVYMADFAAMAVGGGAAARMLHVGILLLTLRVVWRLGDDLRDGAGAWAAAAFAWTPVLMLIGGWAWAEWAMLGLLLLSWHRWWRFVEAGFAPPDAAIAMLALAGAIATKYTAGVWTAIFLPIALVMLLRSRGGNVVRIAAAAAAVLLVFGGFFYVRNVVWTGSPLAPFGLPGSPAVTNFRSSHGGFYELVMGWDIFHPQIIDDALGILLPVAVLASPLALIRSLCGQLSLFMLGVVQTVTLVIISPTSRLILLGLAPLAVLGAVAVFESYSGARSSQRALLRMGIALGMIGQFVLCAFVLQRSYEPLAVLTGSESQDEYLQRMRHYAPVFQWIEEKTPPSSVVLMLGEPRAYHLDRRAHWAGNLDGPRVAAWLGRSRNPGELRSAMRALGITHVLVHKKNYIVGDATDAAPTMLEKEFVLIVPAKVDELLRACLRQDATLVFGDANYLVFALR